MTREIKFRAWDNKRRYFIGNDLLFAFANCALYYRFLVKHLDSTKYFVY